jgi:tRNA-2-methylthio-N6-dimethylallyladenosine synthase
VREHAEQRVFGNVGALNHTKAANPDQIIAVCGCMVQQKHIADKLKRSYPIVDLVFGPHELWRFPELYQGLLANRRRIFAIDPSDGAVAEGIPLQRDKGVKAWLSIMYGCNNFCTYCIVPYVRGRERSRTPDMVLAEARDIVENGFKDITLLGQNVNSYGKNLPEPMSFAQLLKQTADIPGDFWVRFMTSHPKDATQELFDAMASSDKICKHLHLPFQSGSDRILKKMNRHYDRAKYLELVKAARKAMPDISLTSDVIVGFPGETREDFEETLRLVKEVEFTSLYTFIYSPREGTPAAKMEDPISAAEKSAWFTELCKVQEEIAARRCAKMVGSTVKVLCEQRSDKGIVSGRTEGNLVITFPAEETVVGSFAEVKITSARNWTLQGELVKMY